VRNGKVFWTEITGNHTLQAINGVCGQPMALICKQGTGGSHVLTPDTMFSYGTDVTETDVTWGPAEGTLDFMGFIFFQEKYHIVSHVRGYTLT